MEKRGAVQGVLLDASLLFSEPPCGREQITPEVERFLYRFCFSNLRIGVLFSTIRAEFLAEKESLLRAVAPWHALHIQQLDCSHTGHTLTEVTSAFNVPAESCIFITDQCNEDFRIELLCQGWLICFVSDSANSNIRGNELSIKELDDLPSQIAKLNKEVLHDKVLIIGYAMKWSREKDFLRRHAFPFHPTDSWLSFFPINLELPLQQQLASVDLVLQKPTDEIIGIIPDDSGKFMGHIRFSEGMEQLSRYLQEHPHIYVVDPLERILPLLDRDAIQAILQGLSEVTVPGHPRVRSPHFLKVSKFDDPGLLDALDSAKVALPTIVKPQLACGIFDAHTMVQDVTHDHVIVDVNYFSSFKEIQDDKAIPAFWKALQTAASMQHEARYATRS
eukprot:c22072_g1_i1 orf=111-1280(+)